MREEKPPSAVAPASQGASKEVVQPVVLPKGWRGRKACQVEANSRMEATPRLLRVVVMPVAVAVVVRPLAVQETMGWQRLAEQVVAALPVLAKVTPRRAHPLRAAGPVVG